MLHSEAGGEGDGKGKCASSICFAVSSGPTRRTALIWTVSKLCGRGHRIVANQAASALWLSSDVEQAEKQRLAVIAALIGIGPRDELEGGFSEQCSSVTISRTWLCFVQDGLVRAGSFWWARESHVEAIASACPRGSDKRHRRGEPLGRQGRSAPS